MKQIVFTLGIAVVLIGFILAIGGPFYIFVYKGGITKIYLYKYIFYSVLTGAVVMLAGVCIIYINKRTYNN
jgi:hypothetical protein